MDPALLVALVLAGDISLPSDTLFEPELLVELELAIAPPKDPSAASAHQALEAAARTPRSVRVVHPRGAPAPQPLPRLVPLFSSGSPCLQAAVTRGKLRVLLAFRKDSNGALQQSSGVDDRNGQFTDLDPGWPLLLAAAEEVAPWTEERMRAVAEEALFIRQKKALLSDSPLLRWLAAHWLSQHGSEAAMDQLWGPPGSKARQAAQAKARLPDTQACRAR